MGLVFPGTFLFLVLTGGCLFGQKQVTKTLLNHNIKSINIDGSLAYEVELLTDDSQEVSVEALMEGEYGSDLMVLFKESGTTLFIETQFGPNFKMPNDKLSAHKVVSVRVKITLPEYQNVFLSGGSCQVITSGVFRELGLVESEGYGAYRRLRVLPRPEEKTDLTASVRYSEGKREIEDFEAFRAWVLEASADDLLHRFNRPILPTRA